MTKQPFKITYPDRYNEPINQAEEILAITANMKPKAAVKVLLFFLIEYSQMWYKAKCTAMEYCIEQYADIANGYAEGVNRINVRIVELFADNGA